MFTGTLTSCLKFLSCALLLAVLTTAARAQTVFGIDYNNGNSNLYSTDPTTWSTTLIGSTGQYLEGVAISPSGQLFATSSTGSLFYLNSTSGAATLIGSTGRGNIEGITFSGNTLLGVAISGALTVFSIDLTTATTTDIVTLATNPGAVRAIAALDPNTLFVRSDSTTPLLSSVNLTTGAVTAIGLPAVHGGLYGIGFSAAGPLIGFDSDGSVWSIDTTTAATTLLGNTGGQLWLDMTVQSIPEPPISALIALGGGLALLTYRRRRRS